MNIKSIMISYMKHSIRLENVKWLREFFYVPKYKIFLKF